MENYARGTKIENEWGWVGNFGVSGGYFHNIPPVQERLVEWKKK